MDAFVADTKILVTGAAGRLGSVLIRHFLRAGANVVGADLREPAGDVGGLQFIQGDVIDEADVARIFEAADSVAGGIDAVVHVVGMWGGSPLADTSVRDFENILDVNLMTAFLCFREAVRYWSARNRGGHLVAIASMQGADGGVAEQAAYSAAKAGVIRLVESTALEHRNAGITACAVAPSMILFGDEAPGTAGIAVERVARLCAYLASDGATAHNGSTIRAYGSMLR